MATDGTSADAKTNALKDRIYNVIFGYESRAGKYFDLVLIILILSSVIAVLLDSISSINARFHDYLYTLEWIFTGLFTIEYLLRLYSSRSTRGYVFSFYGVVDLCSILPTYLAFIFPSATSLIVLRVLRVLRIFRILKLLRYLGEANILLRVMMQARHKIFVFIFSVLTLIVIFGSLMFMVEGPENGFSSIPASIYWAIVTITTVGYGDITPHTLAGQAIASMVMITGYAIIAVPTGIVSSELINEYQRQQRSGGISRICTNCNSTGHNPDAHFCFQCGVTLETEKE